MAGKPTAASAIVRKSLAANPNVATRTLARQLFTKHRKLWKDSEACRSAIRLLRGAAGVKNRRHISNALTRSDEDAATCERWGALIPEPAENKWAWQTLPANIDRWLIMSDLHLRFHDAKAIRAAMEFAHGCDGVLLNGDILDCYAFSRFEKDPQQVDFDGELDDMERLLDALDAWGAKKIIWKLGNHEFRLERYLIAKGAELLASRRIRETLNFKTWLDLDKRGVAVIDPMDPIAVGKLCVLHGHEMGSGISSPVNPARGAYLRAKECCLIGHQHRTSEHTEQSMLGTTVTTWSVGCLCDLHPRYAPFNKWNSGFAILDMTGGDWTVENHRIVDGKVK